MGRGLRLRLQNPIATVLTAGAVATSAEHLPARGSVVGGMLGGRAMCCYCDPVVCVIRESQGYRVIDPDTDGWDEASSLMTTRARDVVTVWHLVRYTEHGVWCITSRSRIEALRIVPAEGELGVEERAAVRAVAAKALEAKVGEVGPGLATSDIRECRVVWSGYIENMGVMVCLLAFVYSLGWVPRTWRWWIERGPASRVRRGLCFRCAYPVEGLRVCPECGSAVEEELRPMEVGEKPGL